jgi:hypothetical protein
MTECRVASTDGNAPRGRFGYSSSPRLQGLYASRDVVAGRPDVLDQTAESVVTGLAGRCPGTLEVALSPCSRIRVS